MTSFHNHFLGTSICLSQISTVEAEGSHFWKKDRKESQHIFQGQILILESNKKEGSKVLKAQSQKKEKGTRHSGHHTLLRLSQPTERRAYKE